MALQLGELSAVISADDRPFEQGLADSRAKFDKFGEKLQAGAALAGAAIGAALAVGIASTLEIDVANDKLAAQLGATPEMARELGEIAGNLYANAYGESMGQVNDAIRGVIQAGAVMEDDSKEQIESVTASVLDLATAFEQDLGATSRAVGKMIKTGMAKDANEALDLLTRGFQQGTDEAGDLLDTVSEYSTKFRDIGLSGAQAMGLLSQGLHAGARDADTVADALKEFAIIAMEGPEAAADAFKKLGLNAKQMTADIAAGGPKAAAALDQTLDRLRAVKDPVERNAMAVALFGTKAEDLGDALFALDPSSAVQALGDVEGAAKAMGNTLADNASTKLESFKRKAQQVLVEKLAQAIPTIEKVVGFLEKHSAIVGPLVTALGALAVVIGVVSVAMKVYAVAQTFANLALWAFPVTWIVLAIIALIAIFVLLWFKVEGFRNFFLAAGKAIGDAAMWLWNNAIKPAADGIAAAWAWVSQAFMKASEVYAQIVTSIINLSLWLIEQAFKPVAAAAVWLWETILKPTWDAIAGGVTWLYDTIFEPIFTKIMGLVSVVGGVFKSVFGAIGGFVADAFTRALGFAKSGMNGVIGLLNSALGWINTRVIDTANKVPGVNFPHIPSIPRLAQGAIVPATPGGRAVVVGEGREAEAVIPLSKLASMIGAGSGAGGHAEQTIVVNVVVDGEVVQTETIKAVRRNPEEVALANRAGGKSLGFGD